MHNTKVFRLSRSLVFIGFTLLIPALLALLVLLLTTCFALFGAEPVSRNIEHQARSAALVNLKKIDGLPADFVTRFSTDPDTIQVADAPEPVRPDVTKVLNDYKLRRLGSTVGVAGVAFVGGAILIIGYFVTVPTLIVGFLLTLRKKVWRCISCGFIFDRA